MQVNTSGEASKHGVEPGACVTLAKYIVNECPRLKFAGLMTIGMPDYTSKPENFETLRACRREVCEALGMSESECELSMGMSGDFEGRDSDGEHERARGEHDLRRAGLL